MVFFVGGQNVDGVTVDGFDDFVEFGADARLVVSGRLCVDELRFDD